MVKVKAGMWTSYFVSVVGMEKWKGTAQTLECATQLWDMPLAVSLALGPFRLCLSLQRAGCLTTATPFPEQPAAGDRIRWRYRGPATPA